MLEKLKTLYAKYKEPLLYLIFGGLTTAIDWAISFLLYYFWIDATQAPDGMIHVADAIAWAAAVTFAFITNRIWVFESKKRGWIPILGELVGFAGGRVATFLVQEGILLVFVTWLGLNKYLFRILTAVLVIVLNYFISKLFVFRKKDNNT
ncbi:MAG: GtrA family protein [Ruminococcaceae bacterium]|nr:GtrA family protein [Oscillospiraceae bacterium]